MSFYLKFFDGILETGGGGQGGVHTQKKIMFGCLTFDYHPPLSSNKKAWMSVFSNDTTFPIKS